jgi:hypothetical protein
LVLPGIKGSGETGIVGVAPAIANAVYHATGKRVRDLPITDAASDLRYADHRGLGETDERIHEDREAGRPHHRRADNEFRKDEDAPRKVAK